MEFGFPSGPVRCLLLHKPLSPTCFAGRIGSPSAALSLADVSYPYKCNKRRPCSSGKIMAKLRDGRSPQLYGKQREKRSFSLSCSFGDYSYNVCKKFSESPLFAPKHRRLPGAPSLLPGGLRIMQWNSGIATAKTFGQAAASRGGNQRV